MYKYIKNPVNNKKVNIHSKIGKNIIKKYLNFIIGGADASLKDYTDIPDISKYVFNQISENITEIYGIVGLSYFKFDTWYGTKRILLLSDEHEQIVEKIPSDSQEAILYDEFIVNLIQTLANFDKCVDFYLEKRLLIEQGRPLKGGMYRSSIEIPTNLNSLNVLRWIFADCSHRIVDNSCTIYKIRGKTIVSTSTKLDNLRLHNIDLRQNMLEDSGETSLIGPLSDCFTDNVSKIFFDRFLEYVLEIPGHPTREEVQNMCLEEPHCNENKVDKFLDKVEKVKEKINKEQINFNNNNIFNRHIDLNQIIYQFWNYSYSSVAPHNLLRTNSNLTSSLVDIYTILRMLKNFRIDTEDKRIRGPLKCKSIAEQDNIIVYAGESHILCYMYVLSQILPRDSCKYSQRNTIKESISGKISKILKIDKSQGFENFNDLMTNFCEDLSNHSINFYKLNDNTIRMAVERYKNNPKSCPPIEIWNVSQVTDMSRLFQGYRNFNGNIASWNTNNVTDMSFMFADAENFNKPLEYVGEAWNTSKVTNMRGMFYSATSFNQPLNFDTTNVKDMNSMFYNASNFNQPFGLNGSPWNTHNVTNMSEMFCWAEKFNQPLNFTDTSNVTDMSSMFNIASSFNHPLSFNTINVTDMSKMFCWAETFNQPLNFTDTSNVTDMNSMFGAARNFNQPLSFNTKNVTDMSEMFYGATNFNQPLNFNTKKVENMSKMFHSASSFNQDLKNWDTSNVTNMKDMFGDNSGN